jgi:hypothetical protein
MISPLRFFRHSPFLFIVGGLAAGCLTFVLSLAASAPALSAETAQHCIARQGGDSSGWYYGNKCSKDVMFFYCFLSSSIQQEACAYAVRNEAEYLSFFGSVEMAPQTGKYWVGSGNGRRNIRWFACYYGQTASVRAGDGQEFTFGCR